MNRTVRIFDFWPYSGPLSSVQLSHFDLVLETKTSSTIVHNSKPTPFICFMSIVNRITNVSTNIKFRQVWVKKRIIAHLLPAGVWHALALLIAVCSYIEELYCSSRDISRLDTSNCLKLKLDYSV